MNSKIIEKVESARKLLEQAQQNITLSETLTDRAKFVCQRKALKFLAEAGQLTFEAQAKLNSDILSG